jgi:hypothetical protein
MSTQAIFLTPKKKSRPRIKLRAASTPTTFSAITQNLQKAFGQISVSPPSVPDLAIPNFEQVKLPDSFTEEERKKIIHQMTLNYAASVATESTRVSTPKISYKDYETQHAIDIKPIKTPITDSAESFITGLFQFRRAREQFRGWESATFISQYQATSTNSGSDDDNNTADPSKWHELKIDLFKDFEKIDIDDFKAWAHTVWLAPSATLESQDGQSTTYARKVFSEFLFGSMSPDLQKAIQNAIPTARLWNDGPFVWAVLIHRFFPSAIVLRTTILDKMKSATLASHNNDLSAYCSTLWDMNAVVDTTSHSEELVKAFLTQTNTHPSDIIKNHFNHVGLQFFMNTGSQKSFESLLESADRLHTITTSPALPFAASTNKATKNDQNIAALAGIVKDQSGSMKKIVSALSQLDNKFKQGFSSARSSTNRRDSSKGKALPKPTWISDAPSDTSEVKEFNGKPWFWCATCGRWSTTHSTNGMTHAGKTISQHKGYTSSQGKRKFDQSSSSPTSNKKANKATTATPIDGLKSLKAEVQQQNNSSVLSLIAKAAGSQ